MKKIILLLIISMLVITTSVSAFNMEKKITFNLRKGSNLKEGFNKLEELSNNEISFYYDSDINLNKQFKISLQNESYQTTLNLVLQLNSLKMNKVTDNMYYIYPASKEEEIRKTELQVYQQIPSTIKEIKNSLKKIYKGNVELETNQDGDILFVKTERDFIDGIDKVVKSIVNNNTRIRVVEKEYQLTYSEPAAAIEKINNFLNNKTKKLEEEEKEENRANENNILISSVINEAKNSIILKYDKKYKKSIEKLIEQIDTRYSQVEVKVSILEISRDKLKTLGVDYDLSNMISDLVQNDTIYPKKLPGTTFANVVSSYSNVLSSPKIRIKDKKEGNIKIGQDIPIVTAEKDDESSEVVPSVEYRHVGIDLLITPRVHLKSGEISLNLDLSIDSLGEKEATPYGDYYKINIKNIDTDIRLRNNKTVVIGGLITENEREKNTKVPFLADLPIIGKIFQKTENSPEKSEIIMLITPKLVNTTFEESSSVKAIRKNLDAEYNYDERLNKAQKTIARLIKERKEGEEQENEK
ncbi:MAG: type IV pilus assembly protein PilQ [Candidatus Frackibacter sp. T328-2]|nr:MAG: type IV pilus assembly protein PilQ [Candidatus Frackibacter sp. T328-2]